MFSNGIKIAAAAFGISAALFYAGVMYGKSIDRTPSWVPAEKRISITYQRSLAGANRAEIDRADGADCIEILVARGNKPPESLDKFAMSYCLDAIPENRQSLLATRIIEKKDANYKKSLVYTLLPQLSQNDRSELIKSELGSMISTIYSIFIPQSRASKGP